VGRLYYNESNADGCQKDGTFIDEDFDINEEESDEHRHGHKLSPIVIVDRGACHFVTKTRNI